MAARHDQIVNSSGYGTPQSYTGKAVLKSPHQSFPGHAALQVQTLPHNFSLSQHTHQTPQIIEVHRQLPPEPPAARAIPKKSRFSKVGPAMKNIWQVVKYSIILGALLGLGITAYNYDPKPIANRGFTDIVMMTLQIWLQSAVSWLSEFILNPIFLTCVLLVLFTGVTAAICLRRGRRQEQTLARRILKSLSQQLARANHRNQGRHPTSMAHSHHNTHHNSASHALVHGQNSGPTISYAPGHRRHQDLVPMSTPSNFTQSPPTIQEIESSQNALRPYQTFHPYPINFGDHFHTETRTRTINSYSKGTADGGNERIDEVSNYAYAADTRPVYEAVSRKISVESQR